MILVMLGTQDKQFNRLLKNIDDLLNQEKIEDEVIAQIGNTDFVSNKIETKKWFNKEEVSDLILRCDILITHGGVGTIIDGLQHDKPIIVVPRLEKYNEHTNDHQLQITNFCVSKGYCLACYENDNLYDKIIKARNFKPKKYKSNTKKFLDILDNEIEKLL